MLNLRRLSGAVIVAAALSACSSYGPGGVHYSTSGTPEPTGATLGSGSGSVSGGGAADTPEKEQRGNTPIGRDRDGHGPAAGAILDPTGAATGAKPY